jgi:hypothetical protein
VRSGGGWGARSIMAENIADGNVEKAAVSHQQSGLVPQVRAHPFGR